ncbi:ArsR/SmtB family transcription factor [Actinokineospora sp. G85]|uniref:ArsR/SmtB family transcription factor n=1 Tax=Actinokineospora sp. G85 TaxID=3406626 RepID=UPI003C72D8D8
MTRAPDTDLPPAPEIDAAVAALRMLADPTRLRILWLLSAAEHDVTTLAALVETSRPSVSQHLTKLRHTGLVTTRRDGRRIFYTARGGHVRRMVAEALHAASHHVRDLPDHE